jgi:hypothetical protein
MFIKLVKQDAIIYDFSDIFSLLLLRHNQLYEVLRVLKRLASVMQVA